ncbi:MAG: hypothetical protein JWP12_2154 [Bacteroidetes bacterium]|nr:hypothetical protein [Bacteroidota bacterium]
MELDFLENGIDSLRKGFENLIEYENLLFNNSNTKPLKKRFYYLKDAIVFVQHGIEILIKKIIHNHSEYLIFSQIDNNVKNALRQKNDRKLNSVFETDLKHKIHTVTFIESIERLKIIPSISLSSNLEKRLLELENYRNIIMHSEPHFKENEINLTFDGLSDELDTFFSESIGNKYKTISGYDDLIKNTKIFKNILKTKGLELKIKSIEILTKAIGDARISIGSNEVKRITNINNCSIFLTQIFNSDIIFGTDLYNGYCSGKVTKLKRNENDTFEIYTADNDCYFEFKLKSIILYIPEIDDDQSPIIFIESDEIEFQPTNYPGAELDERSNIKSLFYVKAKVGNKKIYDKDTVYKESKDNTYNDYTLFLTKGLFCFLNIQGLEYNLNYNRIIYDHKSMDGKKFEVELRNLLIKDDL